MIAALKDDEGNEGWEVIFSRFVAGASQEELAFSLNMSQSALSNLIRYGRKVDPELGERWDACKVEKANRIREQILPIIDNVVPVKADTKNGIPGQDWRDAIALAREKVQARLGLANALDPVEKAGTKVEVNVGESLVAAIAKVAAERNRQKALPTPEPMTAEIVPE